MKRALLSQKGLSRLLLLLALAGCNATTTCGSWTLPQISFSPDPAPASTTTTTGTAVATRPADTNATASASGDTASDDEEALAEPPSSSFIARAALMSANPVATYAPLVSSRAPNQSLVPVAQASADRASAANEAEPQETPDAGAEAPDPLAQQYDNAGYAPENVMFVPIPLYDNARNLGAPSRRLEEEAPYPQGNGTTSSTPLPSGATNNTVGLTNPPEIPRPIYYPTPAGGNNVRVVIPNPPLVGGPAVFTSPRPGH